MWAGLKIYEIWCTINYTEKITFGFRLRYQIWLRTILDVKTKCIEQGKTQVNLAEEIETTKAYVNRVIKKQDGVVNQTFVKMMEALGYDIELRYVERK